MAETTGLKVGAGAAEITPGVGIHLAGDVGNRRPARRILDPLFARALVLENGPARLCLVALDITIITRDRSDRIRREISRRFGFPVGAVMVHALQIHSAPALGRFMLAGPVEGLGPDDEWLYGSDPRYDETAFSGALAAVGRAMEARERVSVGAGSGIEARCAANRRGVCKDGSVGMPWVWNPRATPAGPTQVRYLEGPMDPELGVVCFRTDDLRRPAVLVNYTAHPVVVYADPRHHLAGTVSADWPGALAACLAGSAGTGTVVVTNGACGNINPWNPFDPDYEKFTDHVRMGRLCAETARTVLGAMEFETDAPLAAESAVVEIPLREVPAEAAAAAERVLAEHPSPRWTDATRTRVERGWLDAAMTAQLARARRERPTFSYEIQVMRIGPAALVGLPGEPFAEIGLAIKLASPAPHTYIVHCVNEYVGYIPTREAFARGGHEVNTSAWSKLSPDACDMIRDAATALLRKAFA